MNKDKVEFEAFYSHPPERVWAALTDADALAQWLMPTDFKPLIGFRFRLDRPDGSAVRGKVTDVEEAKLLAYTWEGDDGEGDSLVVWSLSPDGDGTRIRLEHRVLEEPAVTCLAIDNYFNWAYALRHGLPGLLQLLKSTAYRVPRPPIVYVEEVAI